LKPGTPPSIANGNVLLVTEEDYADEGDEVVCDHAGSFQTWYVPDLDASAYRGRTPDGVTPDVGTIAPLDLVNAPVEFGGGASLPVTGFCSAHWFDVHQDGFVAMGNYGAGLRILDVRDPRNIAQLGYATGVATQVWDAYWVPVRDAKGVAVPGQKTNLVCTDRRRSRDRGLRGGHPGPRGGPGRRRPTGHRPPATGRGSPTTGAWTAGSPTTDAPAVAASGSGSGSGGGALGATGLSPVLAALAVALMAGTALARRRRA